MCHMLTTLAPYWLQSPHYIKLGDGRAMISTLRPWVPMVEKGTEPDAISYRTLSPGDALRSEPGIMIGEPKAVLKAAAFDLLLGGQNMANELLSLTLMRSACHCRPRGQRGFKDSVGHRPEGLAGEAR